VRRIVSATLGRRLGGGKDYEDYCFRQSDGSGHVVEGRSVRAVRKRSNPFHGNGSQRCRSKSRSSTRAKLVEDLSNLDSITVELNRATLQVRGWRSSGPKTVASADSIGGLTLDAGKRRERRNDCHVLVSFTGRGKATLTAGFIDRGELEVGSAIMNDAETITLAAS